MATILSAAPLDVAAVLPDALIEQYVKPAEGQAALLDAFRQTALSWLERHTGHALHRRLWSVAFDGLNDVLYLPRRPVRSVLAMDYVDANGIARSGVGLWRQAGDQIVPAGARWSVTSGRRASVTVSFVAGYDDVASEAPALRTAALMLVHHLYVGGAIEDVPATITMLIDEQYRTPVVA